MKKFNKHKFIPSEKLAKMLGVKEINIGFTNEIMDMTTEWEKTGYAQYTFFKADEREAFLKTFNRNDIIGEYKEKFKLKDIGKIPAFSSLDRYNKIKPIYILKDYYTREKLNHEVLAFPSGRVRVELIGILVK